MKKILNETWRKKDPGKTKEFPQKWLKKTGQEFKKKNKERYHESGIRTH
jgi:hypothetical protein